MIPSVMQLSQKFRENNLLFQEHFIKESNKPRRNPNTRITLMDEIFLKARPIYPITKLPKFHSCGDHSAVKKKSSFVYIKHNLYINGLFVKK